MNAIEAILSNPRTFPGTEPRVGIGRAIYDQLRGVINSCGDFPTPAEVTGVAEVQVIPVYNGDGFTGGTVKLDFHTFQTEAMPFDISTAGVQAAVDAAWLANVPGYTAGDISAQGGPWITQDIILVYEGDFFLTTPPTDRPDFLDVDLEGAGGVLATTYTYAGGSATRKGYAALLTLGIVQIGTLPNRGEDLDAAEVTVPTSADGNRFPYNLSPDTVRALVLEAAIDEGNDSVASVLFAALGL